MSCKVAQEKENGAMLLLEHYVRSSGDETIEGILVRHPLEDSGCDIVMEEYEQRGYTGGRTYGWSGYTGDQDSAGVIVLSGGAGMLGLFHKCKRCVDCAAGTGVRANESRSSAL
jgi:hypothetical protein